MVGVIIEAENYERVVAACDAEEKKRGETSRKKREKLLRSTWESLCNKILVKAYIDKKYANTDGGGGGSR